MIIPDWIFCVYSVIKNFTLLLPYFTEITFVSRFDVDVSTRISTVTVWNADNTFTDSCTHVHIQVTIYKKAA